ncbi:MAG: bifunctional folylpolyglutamate synthase/dihydrofolate synthase [Hydrogenothermaceae bacterium]|nr:bifunctional folylpolyglutamate synthase/dihydrofolate synthase [Hydrogenothermaceae bacterium]
MKLYQLFNQKVFKIEPGLERIKQALNILGNPQDSFPSVLVAGTNGKGSTCAYLESLFRHHGFKTGLFTSPHLIEENERWQINRVCIPNPTLEGYIEEFKDLIQEFQLTYFEACTLIAFKYFHDESVDVAVVEVGLGGRWDATNALYPDVSVITNVSFDHMDLLGNTLRDIAFEKTGITRKDRPVVIGRNQEEIVYWLQERDVKEFYLMDVDFWLKAKGFNQFDYSLRGEIFPDLRLSMVGRRQMENASTALTAFLIFMEKEGKYPDRIKVYQGLLSTIWQGRMQLISQDPLILVDGGHNQEGLEKTFKEVREIFPDKKIITVYSFLKDKDTDRMYRVIKESSSETIGTKVSISRGMDREDFYRLGEENFQPDIWSAVDRAKSIADKNSLILITGSLYLVGELLDGWNSIS